MFLRKKFIATITSALIACNLAYANPKEKHYDAEAIADIFYALNGDSKNPQKKVNHTKGFCASGEFIPAKNSTKQFNIPILQENLTTQVRYSLGGGNISDKTKPRGMALKMEGKSESWEIVMLNSEINFAKNPDEFGLFFEMRVPKNGKVDTAKIQQIIAQTESFRNFEKYMQGIGISKSVANTAYHSIHTFYFQDKKGGQIPARFKFVPLEGVAYLSKDELAKTNDDFLESDFKERVSKKPIAYKMVLILANKNDITNDTTALWSGKHKEIELGTLYVKALASSECNADVFMPNMLPSGVGEPKDPLFQTRNDTYSITFGRRQ